MFNRIKAIINLPEIFKQGKMVSNPEAWKKGQITAGVLAGFIGAIVTAARAFGYDLPLTDEEILTIGSAVVTVTGLFWTPAVTVATTDKIGISKPK